MPIIPTELEECIKSDNPLMTKEEYIKEMEKKGFHFNEQDKLKL